MTEHSHKCQSCCGLHQDSNKQDTLYSYEDAQRRRDIVLRTNSSEAWQGWKRCLWQPSSSGQLSPRSSQLWPTPLWVRLLMDRISLNASCWRRSCDWCIDSLHSKAVTDVTITSDLGLLISLSFITQSTPIHNKADTFVLGELIREDFVTESLKSSRSRFRYKVGAANRSQRRLVGPHKTHYSHTTDFSGV